MKKLKLTALDAQEMSRRSQAEVLGGKSYNCSCGCKEENNGGSTTAANKQANIEKGLVTPGVDVCDSIIGQITITW